MKAKHQLLKQQIMVFENQTLALTISYFIDLLLAFIDRVRLLWVNLLQLNLRTIILTVSTLWETGDIYYLTQKELSYHKQW